MPLYATAPPDSITQTIVDPIVRVTVAHVAAGSKRLIGTVLAAYILFGYVMYQILKEFEWFMEKRHKYLKQPVVENYSVYVRNVPVEYRSNTALHNYFAHCLSSSCAVLDAKLRLKVPTPLLKAVKQRNTLVAKLEHAINFEEIKGRAPMHRQERKFTMSILSSRERSLVPSIPTYTAELRQANRTVTELLESLENNISLLPMSRAQRELGVDDDDGTTNHNSSLVDLDDANSIGMERDAAKENEVADTLSSHSAKRLDQKTVENIMSNNIDRDSSNNDNFVNQSVGLLATKSLSATRTISTSAAKIVQSTKEGEFFSAGFVTFNTLSNTHSIRQMVHHNKPFEIEVMEAPRPEDIFWTNVGRTHKDLQLGKLSSLAATAALCFLWTIPMTFVASLSSVEALSSKIEFLGDLIDRFPFLGRFLGVLAPLLVKFINGLLPTILTYLTLLEGPVSSSVVVASLFSKLATFMIVQTFFVSAVGSSVMNGESCQTPLFRVLSVLSFASNTKVIWLQRLKSS